MSPADVLLAARDLIAEPERWTKGTLARDARGRFSSTKGAGSVCMLGALILTGANPFAAEYLIAHSSLRVVCGGGSVAEFNDAPATTHADVMDAFDRAIRLAKDADGVTT